MNIWRLSTRLPTQTDPSGFILSRTDVAEPYFTNELSASMMGVPHELLHRVCRRYKTRAVTCHVYYMVMSFALKSFLDLIVLFLSFGRVPLQSITCVRDSIEESKRYVDKNGRYYESYFQHEN